MGTFNILSTALICSRCHEPIDAGVELKFGDTSDMDRFGIGDRYKWRDRAPFQNGGRPDGGNVDATGYTECPRCGKDFFVRISIRDDIIQSATADSEHSGYVPNSVGLPYTPER
jgi:hypothetical protein